MIRAGQILFIVHDHSETGKPVIERIRVERSGPKEFFVKDSWATGFRTRFSQERHNFHLTKEEAIKDAIASAKSSIEVAKEKLTRSEAWLRKLEKLGSFRK